MSVGLAASREPERADRHDRVAVQRHQAPGDAETQADPTQVLPHGVDEQNRRDFFLA